MKKMQTMKFLTKFLSNVLMENKIATTRLKFKGLGIFQVLDENDKKQSIAIKVSMVQVWKAEDLSNSQKRVIAALEGYTSWMSFWDDLTDCYVNVDEKTILYTHLFERCCRVCGCTSEYACEGGCSWAESDLCSKCVRKKKRK